jgi:hypothetical protein
MGYYVNITNSDFHIAADRKADAYEAVCRINAPEYDHLKRGGSWGPDGKTAVWYSWMPADYPAETEKLEDVLDLLGFAYVITGDGDITDLQYDNKTGNEAIFFLAMAPYVQEGSTVTWVGEDHHAWIWEFADGTLYLRNVQMVPAGERSEITYFHRDHEAEGYKGERRKVVL